MVERLFLSFVPDNFHLYIMSQPSPAAEGDLGGKKKNKSKWKGPPKEGAENIPTGGQSGPKIQITPKSNVHQNDTQAVSKVKPGPGGQDKKEKGKKPQPTGSGTDGTAPQKSKAELKAERRALQASFVIEIYYNCFIPSAFDAHTCSARLLPYSNLQL